MPSFHISSSGKLVQCKNDPCKLHAGTDFQAKDLKEAQKLAENSTKNNNINKILNKSEDSNTDDYINVKNMSWEEFGERLKDAIKHEDKQDYYNLVKAAGIEPEFGTSQNHQHEVISWFNVGHKGRFVGFEVSPQKATMTELAKNLNMSDNVVKNPTEWKNHDQIIEKFKNLSHDEQQSVILHTLWKVKAGA